ncbi:hypothetical protein B0H14DRAFT_2578805 [Mycena olivaceomarginata]|nr:hypothetical protein B0H14DRAFT_2578805 [Mycena olivaceomarginata]
MSIFFLISSNTSRERFWDLFTLSPVKAGLDTSALTLRLASAAGIGVKEVGWCGTRVLRHSAREHGIYMLIFQATLDAPPGAGIFKTITPWRLSMDYRIKESSGICTRIPTQAKWIAAELENINFTVTCAFTSQTTGAHPKTDVFKLSTKLALRDHIRTASDHSYGEDPAEQLPPAEELSGDTTKPDRTEYPDVASERDAGIFVNEEAEVQMEVAWARQGAPEE